MAFPIFDHHIHMDSRSANEYELMAISGVEKILVPCTFTGEDKIHLCDYVRYFDRLLNFETRRAHAFGIEPHISIAFNSINDKTNVTVDEALKTIENYTQHKHFCAIGELSFKTFSDNELALFTEQLLLANSLGIPVIVESPPQFVGKDRIKKLAAVLENTFSKYKIDTNSIMVFDVCTEEIETLWDFDLGGYGVPVSPALNGLFSIHKKADPNEAHTLIEKYGCNKIMFNSALHFGYGDPISISRVLLHLKMMGVPVDMLNKLAYDNACNFFGVKKC